MTMENIVIWEANVEKARACEAAAYQALSELGLKGVVTINSEPPLISRNKLWDRLPVLEICGQHWSLEPGQPFTKSQLVPLFRRLFCAREQVDPERT